MGKGSIYWVDCLPQRKYVPIMTIRTGKEVCVRAAGPPLIAYAHFFDGRSSPCSAHLDAGCRGCQSQKARAKGFLPAYLQSGVKRIVELTEGVMRNCSFLNHFELLGSWLILRRTGTAPNSPLLCWRDPVKERVMPTLPFDVFDSVEHMWGLDRSVQASSMSHPQG